MSNEDNRESFTELYGDFGISRKVLDFAAPILAGLKDRFDRIDETAEYNQLRVIRAMQEAHIGEANLKGTTGYGYDDIGRDGLEKVYASYFHTEDALVRPQITCGTHALALALMSNLRPGDTLLSAAGKYPGGGHRHPAFQRISGRIRHRLPAGGPAARQQL